MPPPPNGNLSTTNLPILQKASDAYKLWHCALIRMERLTRYSVGEKISEFFIELIEIILTAAYSNRDQKLTAIQKASVKLDVLKYFLQIVWELKSLDNKKLAAIALPLSEVGKMLGGWQRQLRQKTPTGMAGE